MIDEAKFEDIIEQAFWEFDALKNSVEFVGRTTRDIFKIALRRAKNKLLEEYDETSI